MDLLAFEAELALFGLVLSEFEVFLAEGVDFGLEGLDHFVVFMDLRFGFTAFLLELVD